jgi:hypothetical protein
MRAFGEPLAVEDVRDPQVSADGAVIEVRATGVCRSGCGETSFPRGSLCAKARSRDQFNECAHDDSALGYSCDR